MLRQSLGSECFFHNLALAELKFTIIVENRRISKFFVKEILYFSNLKSEDVKTILNFPAFKFYKAVTYYNWGPIGASWGPKLQNASFVVFDSLVHVPGGIISDYGICINTFHVYLISAVYK